MALSRGYVQPLMKNEKMRNRELTKEFDHINNKQNQRAKAIEMLERAKLMDTLKNEFRSVFQTGMGQFFDKEIMAYTGKIVIDIVLFEKYFSKEFGIKDNESLNTAIKRHFGNKGVKMLEKVLL